MVLIIAQIFCLSLGKINVYAETKEDSFLSAYDNIFQVHSNNKLSTSDSLEPGLYNDAGDMLATWQELGLDLRWGSDKSNDMIIRRYPEATKLVIDNSITRIGKNSFFSCMNLKTIYIPEGVTEICDGAFRQCISLSSINIPEGVTNIADSAFEGCRSLSSINLPNGLVEIGSFTFSGCSNLSDITIPEGVTSIGYEAFKECSSLISVEIPVSVTNIREGAFGGCENLTSIKVADGNTVYDSRKDCNAIIETETNKLIQGCKNTKIPNSVTKIGEDAFNSCRGLESLEIPDSVISIGRAAFYECSSLSSIEIPVGVTSIVSDTFANCKKLCDISLPQGLKDIGESAFYACWNIESINIPEGLEEIGSKVFGNCIRLKYLYIPKTVQTIEGSSYDKSPFVGCDRQLTVYCELETKPSGWGYYWNNYYRSNRLCTNFGYTKQDFEFWSSLESAEEVDIPEKYTQIPNGAFCGNHNLKSVTIPNSITEIGEYAFYSYENLNNIIISENITSIGKCAFHTCRSLKYIYIPNSVIKIDAGGPDYSPFEYCGNNFVIYCEDEFKQKGWGDYWNYYGSDQGQAYQVNYGYTREEFDFWSHVSGRKEVAIPDGYKNIPMRAFYGCDDLEKITIPKGVTNIGEQAFYGCSSLGNVTVPEGVTNIGEQAFYGCSSMDNITIPEGVTSIEEETFYGCSNLSSIGIPQSVTGIGRQAFANCSNLSSVSIPEGVTSIEFGAFMKCSNLVSFVIPNGVTEIDKYTFYECSSLKYVYIPSGVVSIPGSVPSSSVSPFEGCLGGLVIYCEEESKPSGWETWWYCVDHSNFNFATVKYGYTREMYISEISTPQETEKPSSTPSGESSATARPSSTPSGESNTTARPNSTPNIVPTAAPGGMVDSTGKAQKEVNAAALGKIKLVSAKMKKKAYVSLKWRALSGAEGYQIQYSTNKKFKKVKTKISKKNKYTIKKLKTKKTYYIRVCAYKIVKGKKVYGKWSNVKKVKLKK